MKEMLISEFRAHYIAEIKKVHRTGGPLTITLRGKPIAQVVALLAKDEPAVKLGSRPGNAVIKRDLAQVDFADEWDQPLNFLLDPRLGLGSRSARTPRAEEVPALTSVSR
jgi:antitoxin (DNA-binding transcriptional repressor) of toxin-antitoxin stability system